MIHREISFAEYCEKHVIAGGGKIVRDGLAHGELNGFIFPARTKETLFWEEQLFTPYGLATLFNLKTKAPNVELACSAQLNTLPKE